MYKLKNELTAGGAKALRENSKDVTDVLLKRLDKVTDKYITREDVEKEVELKRGIEGLMEMKERYEAEDIKSTMEYHSERDI